MIKAGKSLSWDETFMLMTKLIAQKSKEPNTKVGACVVDENNIIVGLGYNGFPRNCDDNEFPWEREGSVLDVKYTYVVHAEANAIMNANKSVKNCSIYVNLFPCNECAKIIIQSGIKEIIYESDKYKGVDIFIASRKMLKAAGVKMREYVTKNELIINKKEKWELF